jgi:hypothetical protein
VAHRISAARLNRRLKEAAARTYAPPRNARGDAVKYVREVVTP